MRIGFAALLAFVQVMVAGCESGRAPGPERSQKADPAETAPHPPTIVRGPTRGAPVEAFIAAEVQKSRNTAAGVLVYVGATWCEPCQRFHQAVTAGQMNSKLSGIRIIEFDLDADREPLERAGYSSRLIPLFVVPRADGTASDLRMEGSIKGDTAVTDNLSPRLQLLLQRARQAG